MIYWGVILCWGYKPSRYITKTLGMRILFVKFPPRFHVNAEEPFRRDLRFLPRRHRGRWGLSKHLLDLKLFVFSQNQPFSTIFRYILLLTKIMEWVVGIVSSGFHSWIATGACQVPRRHPHPALQAWRGPSPKFGGTSNAWIFQMAWQQENC